VKTLSFEVHGAAEINPTGEDTLITGCWDKAEDLSKI
jgi:hypothetical protein